MQDNLNNVAEEFWKMAVKNLDTRLKLRPWSVPYCTINIRHKIDQATQKNNKFKFSNLMVLFFQF
jgi:hypothetical protein